MEPVIFETNHIAVTKDGQITKVDLTFPYGVAKELSMELARLYRLLEEKEDDGR